MTVVPEVLLGTGKVQLNDPAEFDFSEPDVQLVIDTESKTSELKDFDTENPVPDTVTGVPGAPFFGLTLMAGVVTVKLAVAV